MSFTVYRGTRAKPDYSVLKPKRRYSVPKSRAPLKSWQNRQIHPIQIEIERQRREDRHRARVSKATRAYQNRRLWGDLLRPLREELTLTRTQLRLPEPAASSKDPRYAEARTTALRAYLVMLEELNRRLTALRHPQLTGDVPGESAPHTRRANTPMQLAQQEPFNRYVPNALTRGAHWVDWVPPHIRRRVGALFEVIPRVAHARAKAPFVRRVPSAQHKRNLEELRGKTLTSLARAERANLTEHAQQIRRALRVIGDGQSLPSRLHKTAFVPTTWHSVSRLYGAAPTA